MCFDFFGFFFQSGKYSLCTVLVRLIYSITVRMQSGLFCRSCWSCLPSNLPSTPLSEACKCRNVFVASYTLLCYHYFIVAVVINISVITELYSQTMLLINAGLSHNE